MKEFVIVRKNGKKFVVSVKRLGKIQAERFASNYIRAFPSDTIT